MDNKGNKWTEQEKEYIKENCKTKTRKEIGGELGRSEVSVSRMMSILKVYRYNFPPLKIGERFGGLEIIGEMFYAYDPGTENKKQRIECFCHYCNNKYITTTNSLRNGTAKSCGCNQKNTVYRKYSVNKKFFHTWSADMAYILGFIVADGNIDDTRFRIGLKDTDIEILEYIKEKLEYTGPINHVERKHFYKNIHSKKYQVHLSIWSYEIVDKLKEYGVVPNKTGKEILPDVPDEYFYDFLRGNFDGDGCYYFYKDSRRNTTHLRFTLYSANKDFLEKIKDRCGNIGSIHPSNKNNTCFVWTLGYWDSIEMGKRMYKNDNSFALDRKKKRWVLASKSLAN